MPPAWTLGGHADSDHHDASNIHATDSALYDDVVGQNPTYEDDEEMGDNDQQQQHQVDQHMQQQQRIPTANGTEVVRRESGMEDGSASEMIAKDGFWICKPYKREIIAQQLNDNSPGANRRMALIGALRDLGVKVFIIEAKSIQTTKDILHHVRRVVGFCARENTARGTQPLGFQRCLLYQDKTGRLFNLLLAQHAIGPAARFQEYLDSFSGVQAMMALTILARSIPCLMEGSVETLRPALVAFILGLVFTEEISLCWLNASMLIRSSPSVSAHTLTSRIAADSLRKGTILTLALASAAEGRLHQYMTLCGMLAAMGLLLSNLGSRAWYFMRWRPLRYQGNGAGFVAFMASILCGFMLPYMGHRKIQVGGKGAVEHVIVTAIVVAIVFLASDIEELQKFLLVGSVECDQNLVNVGVGAWWMFTFVSSLFLVRRIPYQDDIDHLYTQPHDGEPLLLEDHASPVGYKVPSLPDFEMDPSLAESGSIFCLNMQLLTFLGLVVAVVFGAAIVYMGFDEWDRDVKNQLEDYGLF